MLSEPPCLTIALEGRFAPGNTINLETKKLQRGKSFYKLTKAAIIIPPVWSDILEFGINNNFYCCADKKE